MKKIKIALLGTFNPNFRPHLVVQANLEKAAQFENIPLQIEWISTESLNNHTDLFNILGHFDGIWCSPGSPYKSLEGALNGIRFARENRIPFIGTCAGFQHLILEYARNVLSYENANSGEYEANGKTLFITPLTCGLAGQTLDIDILENSLAHRVWNKTLIQEHYYCNYGLNPAYQSDIQNSALVISAWDGTKEPRIIELPEHPFFIGTLFVPGDDILDKSPTSLQKLMPHPLISAFVKACQSYVLLKKNIFANT